MDDGKTLKDYKISNKSAICLRFDGEIKIILRTMTERTFTFIVKTSMKIEQLKTKIKELRG